MLARARVKAPQLARFGEQVLYSIAKHLLADSCSYHDKTSNSHWRRHAAAVLVPVRKRTVGDLGRVRAGAKRIAGAAIDV